MICYNEIVFNHTFKNMYRENQMETLEGRSDDRPRPSDPDLFETANFFLMSNSMSKFSFNKRFLKSNGNNYVTYTFFLAHVMYRNIFHFIGDCGRN